MKTRTYKSKKHMTEAATEMVDCALRIARCQEVFWGVHQEVVTTPDVKVTITVKIEPIE